jgi:hypothetical protein
MTRVNRPSVRQVIGREMKLIMGRMSAFTSPNMTATKKMPNTPPVVVNLSGKK